MGNTSHASGGGGVFQDQLDSIAPLSSLYAFHLSFFLASQIVLPAIPLLALRLHVTPFWVGLTVGSSAILPFLAALPIGWFASTTSPKRLQLGAAVVAVGGFAFIFAASSILLLIVGQTLVGLSLTIASIAAQAYIASSRGRRDQDRAFGQWSFVVALSSVLGPIFGGLLLDWGGPKSTVFAGLAVSIAAVLQASVLSDKGIQTSGVQPGLIKSSLAVLRIQAVLPILLFAFLIIFCYSLRSSFYVVYLNELAFSGKSIGLLLAVNGLAAMVARPALAGLMSYFGRPRVLVLVCFAMGIGLGLVPLVKVAPIGQAGLAIMTGIAYGLSQPLTMSMLSHAVPPESTGMVFGWRQFSTRGAELTGPLLVGMMVMLAGLETAFVVVALVLTLTGFVVLRLAAGWEGS